MSDDRGSESALPNLLLVGVKKAGTTRKRSTTAGKPAG